MLLPYVPRLVADWAATRNDETWRPIEGTMVFADLSGFTAMSERLSRLGRVGAEEVTDAIGGCFAELLEVAYGAGGGLLKFGGDALLLAFVGDDHVVRAVWSAAAMRERLRTAGRLKTSAGNVTLRMSVGVHTGTFDFFLVGSPSRELLVTGAAASEVVAMEHDASAGQIVISKSTATALPERCIGAPLGPGFLLRRAPEQPSVHVDTFDNAYAVDLREFVPAAVSEHVLAGGGGAEHRVVTVAFVHFDGLDARLREHGPERTAHALDELVHTVEEACAAHDVALLATDVDGDGGKFLLTAGAPSVRGHEEKRMLATVRRIVEADLAIPVRVGVNRGPVFAGDVGPHYRRTYTVMGDTVNLAARLMAAAAPGRVVATSNVLDLAVGFASAPLPPMRVKGKRAPVQAYEVGAAHASTSSDHADIAELPFVGREAELAQLETFLADARAGEGVSVRIAGPAGIGKSRLLGELRARAPEMRSVRATCEAYELATPYATVARLVREALPLPNDASAERVADALRAAVAAHAPDLEPYLPLVGSVLDVDIPDTPETATLAPQYRATRVADTTASLLAAALRGPTLVVIDDSEWIDEASREVVEKLGALATEARIVLVCIARDDTLADDDALVVGPLATEEVETALRQATEGAPLRPHELAALTARADGNPLFLTELWRAATDGEDTDALPDSIEALITAQLDRLKPSLRTVLGYAAILGRGFDRTELHELLGDDVNLDADVWGALAEFVDLEAGTRARFRHGLMRDAAYGKLPFRRRRELHLRAACGSSVAAKCAPMPRPSFSRCTSSMRRPTGRRGATPVSWASERAPSTRTSMRRCCFSARLRRRGSSPTSIPARSRTCVRRSATSTSNGVVSTSSRSSTIGPPAASCEVIPYAKPRCSRRRRGSPSASAGTPTRSVRSERVCSSSMRSTVLPRARHAPSCTRLTPRSVRGKVAVARRSACPHARSPKRERSTIGARRPTRCTSSTGHTRSWASSSWRQVFRAPSSSTRISAIFVAKEWS